MPTRTPHTFVATEVLTAANLNNTMAKGFLGSGTGTATGIDDSPIVDVASVTVTVEADRLLKITAVGQISNAATAVGAVCLIREGTDDLGRVHVHDNDATVSFCAGSVLVNDPSAGSHTYKLSAYSVTSGSFDMDAITNKIIVEDIGPAY